MRLISTFTTSECSTLNGSSLRPPRGDWVVKPATGVRRAFSAFFLLKVFRAMRRALALARSATCGLVLAASLLPQSAAATSCGTVLISTIVASPAGFTCVLDAPLGAPDSTTFAFNPDIGELGLGSPTARIVFETFADHHELTFLDIGPVSLVGFSYKFDSSTLSFHGVASAYASAPPGALPLFENFSVTGGRGSGEVLFILEFDPPTTLGSLTHSLFFTQTAAVPKPENAALIAVGLGVVAWRVRRRKRRVITAAQPLFGPGPAPRPASTLRA